MAAVMKPKAKAAGLFSKAKVKPKISARPDEAKKTAAAVQMTAPTPLEPTAEDKARAKAEAEAKAAAAEAEAKAAVEAGPKKAAVWVAKSKKEGAGASKVNRGVATNLSIEEADRQKEDEKKRHEEQVKSQAAKHNEMMKVKAAEEAALEGACAEQKAAVASEQQRVMAQLDEDVADKLVAPMCLDGLKIVEGDDALIKKKYESGALEYPPL